MEVLLLALQQVKVMGILVQPSKVILGEQVQTEVVVAEAQALQVLLPFRVTLDLAVTVCNLV